ncbi:MAG: hypothetical protein HYU29_07460 [Chloroflexi bacterium]|nr:hypothetical protein [Chloroflexota bacterium]
MAKQKAETPSLVPHQAPLLMLMDGHALVHQSWHAFPTPLSISRTGEIITGAFGFTSTFLKALQDWQPTHCAIAFDRPTPTFRHIEFKEYKATRPEAPPELRQQFVRVRQLMEAFAIPVFELDGFEADDILVTLSRQAQEIGLDTIILTRDTDILQCVSPLVRVVHYRIQERKVYDEKAVRERYGGLGPHQLPDFKALRGDKSDNIPGVPGIGDKTATRLLLEFGNVEEIYQNLDRVDPKLRPALEQHRQSALKARHLNLLVTDVPVQLDLEASRFGSYDRAQVVDLFRELEFSSLLSRVPEGRRPTPQIQPPLIATGPVASTYRLVAHGPRSGPPRGPLLFRQPRTSLLRSRRPSGGPTAPAGAGGLLPQTPA